MMDGEDTTMMVRIAVDFFSFDESQYCFSPLAGYGNNGYRKESSVWDGVKDMVDPNRNFDRSMDGVKNLLGLN